jgi:hypothetical protein
MLLKAQYTTPKKGTQILEVGETVEEVRHTNNMFYIGNPCRRGHEYLWEDGTPIVGAIRHKHNRACLHCRREDSVEIYNRTMKGVTMGDESIKGKSIYPQHVSKKEMNKLPSAKQGWEPLENVMHGWEWTYKTFGTTIEQAMDVLDSLRVRVYVRKRPGYMTRPNTKTDHFQFLTRAHVRIAGQKPSNFITAQGRHILQQQLNDAIDKDGRFAGRMNNFIFKNCGHYEFKVIDRTYDEGLSYTPDDALWWIKLEEHNGTTGNLQMFIDKYAEYQKMRQGNPLSFWLPFAQNAGMIFKLNEHEVEPEKLAFFLRTHIRKLGYCGISATKEGRKFSLSLADDVACPLECALDGMQLLGFRVQMLHSVTRAVVIDTALGKKVKAVPKALVETV